MRLLNPTVIIQARMGSTRLPGKVMKDLCGKPVLSHVVNRVNQSRKVTAVVVATTLLPEDAIIQKFCESQNIFCFRGSPDNVLSRYYDAAKKFKADPILRITSDCPLIDPQIIDEMLSVFDPAKMDYLTNRENNGFPRGLDVEIFPFKILENIFNLAEKDFEKEHVTPYIYQHPEKFKIQEFKNKKNLSSLRWTLDTEDDWNFILSIYRELFPNNPLFTTSEILRLLKNQPSLSHLNSHVEQKEIRSRSLSKNSLFLSSPRKRGSRSC